MYLLLLLQILLQYFYSIYYGAVDQQMTHAIGKFVFRVCTVSEDM